MHESIWEKIIQLIPKIKTKIHLAGLSIAITSYLAIELITPSNLKAQIAAQTFAFSVIFIAYLPLILSDLSKKERAGIVKVLVFCFFATQIILSFAAVYFVMDELENNNNKKLQHQVSKISPSEQLTKNEFNRNSNAIQNELSKVESKKENNSVSALNTVDASVKNIDQVIKKAIVDFDNNSKIKDHEAALNELTSTVKYVNDALNEKNVTFDLNLFKLYLQIFNFKLSGRNLEPRFSSESILTYINKIDQRNEVDSKKISTKLKLLYNSLNDSYKLNLKKFNLIGDEPFDYFIIAVAYDNYGVQSIALEKNYFLSDHTTIFKSSSNKHKFQQVNVRFNCPRNVSSDEDYSFISVVSDVAGNKAKMVALPLVFLTEPPGIVTPRIQ